METSSSEHTERGLGEQAGTDVNRQQSHVANGKVLDFSGNLFKQSHSMILSHFCFQKSFNQPSKSRCQWHLFNNNWLNQNL